MDKKEILSENNMAEIIENRHRILEDFCKAYLASKDIRDVEALKELLLNDRITLEEEFEPPSKVIYSLSIKPPAVIEQDQYKGQTVSIRQHNYNLEIYVNDILFTLISLSQVGKKIQIEFERREK